jgi:hypothetical protein
MQSYLDDGSPRIIEKHPFDKLNERVDTVLSYLTDRGL